MLYSPEVYKEEVAFLEEKVEYESKVSEPTISKLYKTDTLRVIYTVFEGIVSYKLKVLGIKNKVYSDITPEYLINGIKSILGDNDYSFISQLFKIKSTYFYSISTAVEEYENLLNELDFDRLCEFMLNLQEATGMGKELINCLNIAFPDRMKGVV